jgi:predicted extracellular nuclease
MKELNMNRLFVLLTLWVIICSGSCTRSKPMVAASKDKQVVVAFYNVENLFDFSDDPTTQDEDFTPSGKLAWDETRYRLKLQRIAEVIDTLPGDLPVFVGLCEIENEKVLQDLTKETLIKNGIYGVIHNDSRDERGIDVAAIYDKQRLKVVDYNYIEVRLPVDSDPFTRDILHVEAIMNEESIHFFVNHWPSRSGGQAESEPLRIYTAQLLKGEVEKLTLANPNVKVIIMGDFNDHPTDKSIAEVLGAGNDSGAALHNFMKDDHLADKGSYFYKGTWGALDQFIVSAALHNAEHGWSSTDDQVGIFYNPFLLFTDKEGVTRPDRTYIGERYNPTGHSDHLPIWMLLEMK